jgi:hypothetical protein
LNGLVMTPAIDKNAIIQMAAFVIVVIKNIKVIQLQIPLSICINPMKCFGYPLHYC